MHKSYSNPDVSHKHGAVARATSLHGNAPRGQQQQQQHGGHLSRDKRSPSNFYKIRTSKDLTQISEQLEQRNEEQSSACESSDGNWKGVRVKRRIIRRSNQPQQQQHLSRNRATDASSCNSKQLTQLLDMSSEAARSPERQRGCSSEDDDDDVSSICSDPSAVMWRSLDTALQEREQNTPSKKLFRKKKMKRIRRSCPVHGKQHLLKKYGEMAKGMPEYSSLFSSANNPALKSSKSMTNLPHLWDIKIGDVFTIDTSLPVVQEEQSSDHCTCDKVRKSSDRFHKAQKSQNSSKMRSSRVEPEGGHCAISSDMNEFHKLIYENEPLFSDNEDDNNDIAKQVREESERYHKRSTQMSKNIFASALCYNSSTMMKLAIIQNEIRNLQEGSLKLVR